ncbi:MAG: DUF4154 domain-containing protein [Flavobacteriales bacterium]|nr:DUF4154 domain-containing protein [Flavobacteriales bacterium]
MSCFFLQELASRQNRDTNGEIKAVFVYNFSKYIEWPVDAYTDTFRIAVLVGNKTVFNALQKMAVKHNKNKNYTNHVVISELTNLESVKENKIVYFDKSCNTELAVINDSIKGSSTLLVSDNYPYGKPLINMIVTKNRVRFELSEERVKRANLKVSKLLKNLAILTETEWNSVLEKVENLADSDDETITIDTKDLNEIIGVQKELLDEIENNKKRLQEQIDKLDEQESHLTKHRKSIIEKKNMIEDQKILLQEQIEKMDHQEKGILEMSNEMDDQQDQLEIDEKRLAEIRSEYSEVEDVLKSTEELVQRREVEIQNQKGDISEKAGEIERQRTLIALAVGSILVISALGFWALHSYRQKKKANVLVLAQKAEIEEAHKEITDSIASAQRIQKAILPPDRMVNEYLPNSFVMYQPKDVVAGDFYWIHKKDNKILFAAADCTGHEAPGAMMSVLCNNALNRSVREYSLTDPGQTLDKTREIVIEEFEKADDDVKGGMDICLCSLEGNKLKFAGAYNPL